MNTKGALESAKNRLFRGTTCGYHVQLVQSNERWAYFKKKGHSSYIGRFSPPVWCNTIHVLLDLKNLPAKMSYHSDLQQDPATELYVEGRLSKKDKAIIEVAFMTEDEMQAYMDEVSAETAARESDG